MCWLPSPKCSLEPLSQETTISPDTHGRSLEELGPEAGVRTLTVVFLSLSYAVGGGTLHVRVRAGNGSEQKRSHIMLKRCSHKLLNKGLLKVVETDHGKHDKNCFQIQENAFLSVTSI